MEKEFVKYEQALALKELGFDEPCLGYYDTVAVPYLTYPSVINKNSDIENSLSISKQDKNVRCSSPTYSQAFRFFREKHNLMFQIFYLRNGNHTVIIHRTTPEYMDLVDQVKPSSGCVDEIVDCYSYEEAESVCLDKLIKICKNNYCHYSGLPSTSSYDQ